MRVEEPAADLVARWRDTLSDSERERAAGFRRPTDATTYIAAHALTRVLLSDVAGEPPRYWRFVVGARGKPAVAEDRFQDLCFSLAHTHGVAAVAVSEGSAVGIDVERSDRPVAVDAIAGHFFSPQEVALLDATPATERRGTFYRLWTLKEAYLKGIGEGLHRPLDSFAFTLDPVEVHFSPEFPDDPDAWQFFERIPTSCHALALAVHRHRSEQIELIEREVDPRQLL